MKNALTLFLLFFTIFGYAQNDNWIPFLLETGVWTNFTYQVGNGENAFPDVSYHYSTLGDTLIDETTYFKLVVNSDSVSHYRPRSPQVDVYVGAIRQEDRRVLFIPKDSIAIDTLYDFNIEVGDITYRYFEEKNNNCDPNESERCPVTQLSRIDTLQWNDGTTRLAYRFKVLAEGWGEDDPDYYDFSWIEGIGSTAGFFNNQGYIHRLYFSVHSPHYWQELLCMEDNGELLYRGESYDGECNLILDEVDFGIMKIPFDRGRWTEFQYQLGDWEASIPDVSLHYYASGDTLINNTKYFKFVYDSDGYTTATYEEPTKREEYVGSVRQEENKVFFLAKDANEERLLYDFDMKVGDRLERPIEILENYRDSNNLEDCPFTQLVRIDTIPFWLGGKDRQYYRFKKMYEGEETNTDEYDFSWIEGIGSTLGFLNPQDLYLGLLLANPLPLTELLCFEDVQTTILYKGPSYDGSCNIIHDVLDATKNELQIQLELYPNPTTSFVQLKMDDSKLLKNLKYQWSDYTGKVLSDWQAIERNTLQLDLSQLPKGLLFLTISDGQRQLTRKVVKME